MGTHKDGETSTTAQPAKSARPEPTSHSTGRSTPEDRARGLTASGVKIGMIVDDSAKFTGDCDISISMSEEYVLGKDSASTQEQDDLKKTEVPVPPKGSTGQSSSFTVENHVQTFLNMGQASSRIGVTSGNFNMGSLLPSTTPSSSVRIGMVIGEGSKIGGNGTINIDMSERYVSYK